jgi:hypothetical protein
MRSLESLHELAINPIVSGATNSMSFG